MFLKEIKERASSSSGFVFGLRFFFKNVEICGAANKNVRIQENSSSGMTCMVYLTVLVIKDNIV